MRWIIHPRHAGLAIDIAAAATLAAAVGFAIGVGTADTSLACSAATIAFILAVASLGRVDAGGADRDLCVDGRVSAEPRPAARGQILQFPGASRKAVRPSLAQSESGRSEAVAPDASQALSNALAELRRSLR